jgi:AcrR family transcriptional regulator
MADRRYHHGDLRAALLTKAGDSLRVSGVDGLSLRELARSIGVSHAAPRRHFQDKAALMEALVADGFQQLGRALAAAASPADRDLSVALKDVATAYIRFATDNVALVDLMSGARYLNDSSAELAGAQEATFAPLRDLVEAAQASGDIAGGDVRQICTLILAMLHGLATMSNNRMIDALDGTLIDDVVRTLLNGLSSAG